MLFVLMVNEVALDIVMQPVIDDRKIYSEKKETIFPTFKNV